LKEKINTAKSENNKLNALRDYAFVFVMVTTGLRTISITRMNIADLTLLYGTHIAYVQHKGRTDKDDFVVLEAATYKAIFDYLKFRLKIDDFLKLPESTSAEPLFVGHSNRNNGERLTTDRLRQVVKAHLRTIGLNHKVFSAHSLRHTYGTLQLRLTGDIFQVAENMGHKDLKSTKRYTAKERQRQRIDTHTPLTHLFKKDE
jgi:integrase